ncbi:MAG: hypothetical protein JW842_01785 [Prolixibacteraceae bacterium]|nr:hypothetical protein [Prolixibacteraceae bacterium]
MKNKKLKILLFILVAAFVVFSCKEDESPEPHILTEKEKENRKINQWIIYSLGTYYLWESELPAELEAGAGDPETFFNSLLVEQDKWSYIVDDFEEYFAEFEGTPKSMGFSPEFWLYNGGNNIMIVVQYVYPGSPAEIAGLKRGDIILKIENMYLTPDNYYDLFTGDSYSVQLASISGNILNQIGEPISIMAETIDANPSIFHDVYDLNGTKTGYLVYSSFVAGSQDYYLNKLSEVIEGFQAEGVSEVIVDLRYNRGGDMEAARHMASMFVPLEIANQEDVMVRYMFNAALTNDVNTQPEMAIERFEKGLVNLNLDNVYFLVTSTTASASEVVITSLQPYMNITIIGTNTSGKYVGMYVLDHLNNNGRYTWGKHNWGMIPITFKYANADGYTDFINGLTPDYEIEDDLLSAVPFGDPSDPLLEKAFELISGQVSTASFKSQAVDRGFVRLEDDRFSMLNNLIINGRKLE